jgi:hypothetical protein
MIKRIRSIPKTVVVARDPSLIAITNGLIGVPFTALMPPDATYDFPLIVRRGQLLDDNAPRSRFMIIVSWRSARSIWMPRWLVFIWCFCADLAATGIMIYEAASAYKEADLLRTGDAPLPFAQPVGAERGPRAGGPADHQRPKRGAVNCTAAQTVAAALPASGTGNTVTASGPRPRLRSGGDSAHC